MHAVPCRNREGRQADGRRSVERSVIDRAIECHARRFDLRSRPGSPKPADECAEILSRGAKDAAQKLVNAWNRWVESTWPKAQPTLWAAIGGVMSKIEAKPSTVKFTLDGREVEAGTGET